MTAVAMLRKRGRRREAEACKYRQKDYIALHMFGIWVSATIAYFMMTGALLIFILGKNPDQYIAFETMGQVAILWGLVYVIFCLAFEWIAWICYSARYRKAKGWQRRYRYAVRRLEAYYNAPAEQESNDEWLISAEEGNKKKL